MGKTRLFSLTWTNAKNPKMEAAERFRQRNTVGVHFHTGFVALSGGSGYNSMDELQQLLKQRGNVTIKYMDDVSSVEITEDDHAQAS